MSNNNNFRFPEVTNEIHSYWLMGISGGQILNGHFGYVEIAPESTFDLLVVEFEKYLLPFTIKFEYDAALRN